MLIQFYDVGAVFVYCGIGTFIILKVIDIDRSACASRRKSKSRVSTSTSTAKPCTIRFLPRVAGEVPSAARRRGPLRLSRVPRAIHLPRCAGEESAEEEFSFDDSVCAEPALQWRQPFERKSVSLVLPGRLALLPPGSFAQLATLLDQIPPGGEIINLSVGDPRGQVPEFVTETLQRYAYQFGEYPPVNGTCEWREAAAGWLTRRFDLPEKAIDPERMSCRSTARAKACSWRRSS